MIKTTIKLSELNPIQLREIQTALANLNLYNHPIDGLYGPNTQKAWEIFKRNYFLSDPDAIGPASYRKLIEESAGNPIPIGRPTYDRVFRYARAGDRDLYFLPINHALEEFQISTPQRMAAFLAQLSHESANLRYSEEIASGAAYEGRRDLGNTSPGDGVRFKGRGLIQLTGRANYRGVGRALGVDLEGNPRLASSPQLAARIAGYFWQSRGLNSLADRGDFRRITRVINGGYNGWEDRVRRWEWAKECLGVSWLDSFSREVQEFRRAATPCLRQQEFRRLAVIR